MGTESGIAAEAVATRMAEAVATRLADFDDAGAKLIGTKSFLTFPTPLFLVPLDDIRSMHVAQLPENFSPGQ